VAAWEGFEFSLAKSERCHLKDVKNRDEYGGLSTFPYISERARDTTWNVGDSSTDLLI
jgi:hypothetical protein